MAYTREPLSGSPGHGRGIKVAVGGQVGDTANGTTIHTGQASTTLSDVVSLSVFNSHTNNTETVVFQWGGTTYPDDYRVFRIPPRTELPVISDGFIRNSLVIRAFCSTTNACVVYGFVNTEA